MFPSPAHRSHAVRIADAVFVALALAMLVLLTTRYQMPFRLDDVLHIEWAREYSLLDAFTTEIVRSLRPLFAVTVWILTHTAGTDSYFPWHLTLVASFLIGLAFTGLTARYITGRASALYASVTLFWIVFLPILNVLFWFGDLTFTLELMFTAAAWYYGLRGLLEARLGFWIAGCFLAIFAVLSKEPAIVLTNVVFIGTFVFYVQGIREAWINKSRRSQLLAILAYLALVAVSVILFLASPTKSNRFFDVAAMQGESLQYYMSDRLRYYGEIFAPAYVRLLLLLPMHYMLIDGVGRTIGSKKKWTMFAVIFFATFIVVFGSRQPLFVIAYYIAVPIIASFTPVRYKERLLLLVPFALCMAIVFVALLITIMLVKTQLVEFAFLVSLVSGCFLAYWFESIATVYSRLRRRRGDFIAAVLIAAVLIAAAVFLSPSISSKESLLREVQATRFNANDAIKWMAIELPRGSTVLVTGPKLYGRSSESELASSGDATKAYAQYTFLQGYIATYFELLGRPDLQLAYLEDSLEVHDKLNRFRASYNNYLFLQTGQDYARFHSTINNEHPIRFGDTLLAAFARGKYASEIWKLK